MMRSIYEALKPGGLVYLLEYRAEDPKSSHQAAPQNDSGPG